jgi:hypothetical protein
MKDLRRLSAVEFKTKHELYAGCYICKEIFIHDLSYYDVRCPNGCQDIFISAVLFRHYNYDKLKKEINK